MILVGGLVLLTPGILTDIFGFAMMVPGIRKSLAKQFNVRIPKGFTSANTDSQTGLNPVRTMMSSMFKASLI